jgi:DHA2 family methylenomycin A resistance protein-like MFS transporter
MIQDLTGRRGLRLTLLCVGVFMVYLDTTIVNVALPRIQADLHADIVQLQWIVNAYALVFACLLLTSGTLGDMFGRKRMFLGGLAGFTVASALCALAPTIELLLAARTLQGVFGSVMIPVSLALISGSYADPVQRARAIGIWAGLGGVALAAGPVGGGLLVARFGWQSIFWVNVPIGVLGFVALAAVIRESTPVPRKVDVPGQALFILGIAAATYGLIEGTKQGWGSAPIVTAFVVAAVSIVLFLLWEFRVPQPMLPVSFFRNRVVVVAALVNFLALFGPYASLFLLTLYLQSINHLSPVQAGLSFLPITLAIMVASYLASILAARYKPRWLIVIGAVVAAAGLLGFTVLQVGSGFGAYWWSMALVGVGGSMCGAPATVAMMSAVPPQQAGAASGVSNTFRQVGTVFGTALGGTLLLEYMRGALPSALSASSLPPDVRAGVLDTVSSGSLAQIPAAQQVTGQIFVDGMHLAMVVAAVGTLIGGLVALFFLTSRAKAASGSTSSAGASTATAKAER